MYTLQDRMRAVNLFLKYDRSYAAVCRELGYPTKKALRLRVKEYESTGTLHAGYRARPPKYSQQQQQAAVNYYLQHGQNLRRTIKALCHPHRATLRQWLDEAVADRRRRRTGQVAFTRAQKESAVIDLCSRDG